MEKRRSPLPAAVDDVARQARDLLLPIAQKKSYSAGTLLWREGDTAGSLVALERGRVKIYRVLPNGHAVTIYLFGPGDVFGFMPFLDGRPYPATAQALEDVEALVVRREALVAAFGSNPQLAMALIGLLARRLREAFDRIERVSVPEVMPRVVAALASLLPEAGAAGELTVINLPVHASELAAALGIAPESFSRAVTKLVREGVLHRLGPRKFQVLDPARLREAATGPG
jgi:CRP/FNR family transcriptional regulator